MLLRLEGLSTVAFNEFIYIYIVDLRISEVDTSGLNCFFEGVVYSATCPSPNPKSQEECHARNYAVSGHSLHISSDSFT